MFHISSPRQDPCRSLAHCSLYGDLCCQGCFSLAEVIFVRLNKFRGHPLSCKFFSSLGHHAEFNAHSTSSLTVTVISPLLNPSCTNSFTAMIASIVLVCEMNPYWFFFRNSVQWMWWLILFISAFSSHFPPMLRRLIGRYLVTSWLFCVWFRNRYCNAPPKDTELLSVLFG